MTVLTAAPRALPRASVADTLAAARDVVLPTLSKGVIVRRPRVVGLAERMNLDTRAVRRMQALHEAYGDGPLMLRIPGRSHALVLCAEDAWRMLRETPFPFSPDTAEKHAALAHLEPDVSLISEGADRADRRRFNDRALDSDRPVHRMADALLRPVWQEMGVLGVTARARGALAWDEFITAWYAMVRRIVLGDAARDDHALTDMLRTLRADANWVVLPGRPRLLRRVHDRLAAHLDRAEPGSLAARIADLPRTGRTAPTHQVAHWLFAFDPGGMASFRALALILAHPEAAARGRAEAMQADGLERLPFLRACILESLRLWPTTPAILRETRTETEWRGAVMPANTSVTLYAPFFHRDDRRFPFADRFHPDLWTGRADSPEFPGGLPFVPFSGGPGFCPARNLVPMLGAAALAELLRTLRLGPPDRLHPGRPMPGVLDNYTIAFPVAG